VGRAGQPERTYCAFDFDGGNCTELNLCTARYSATNTIHRDLPIPQASVLLVSEPYTDSMLPRLVTIPEEIPTEIVAMELTASDGGATVYDREDGINLNMCRRITINNQPPVCTEAAANLALLWPPNHKFVPVNVLGVTDPDGDPITITIDSIYQDEPTDTFGDGRFTPDGQGVGTATAEVRAERSGSKKVPGDGRVYHIGFTADDGLGGLSWSHIVGQLVSAVKVYSVA
jgi:hypothetical protein